jgi:type IV pilus assembly protein PilC
VATSLRILEIVGGDSMSNPTSVATFAYRAQSAGGQAVSGTIDAASHDEAMERLQQSLGMRVLDLLAVEQEPRRGRAIRGEDFLAFNQQLSQLTSAGMPIEQGLRLIAHDMRSRRLASTVRQIADELDKGVPLGQAFDRQRGKFPVLYGRLIDAGVKANNLPGMLLNLGAHVEMVQRLRAMLWRSVSYPLMVFVGVVFVLAFVGIYIVPRFEAIFVSFGTELPAITRLVLAAAHALPQILIVLASIFAGAVVIAALVVATGAQRWVADHVMLRVPLVGPVLRLNRVARWCDAMKMGVEAGLDLPRAVELTSAAIGSPLLERDGRDLVQALESGQPVSADRSSLRLLPATVPAAMGLGIHRGQLAEILGALASMYQQQAENRMSLIPVILAPFLMTVIALLIGLIILAMFAPILSLISAVSGA